MYHIVEARIRAALGEFLSRRGIQDIAAVTQRSPNVAMGEVATPVAFELAKRLRRAPRQIAQEIAAELAAIPGVARVELAGAGYVNFFFDRAAFFQAAFSESTNAGLRRGSEAGAAREKAGEPKNVVEHTNINPNKAAHIGHLRNAALGDTFVRLLRRAGRRVEVQNYIDNTGVQVADVVVGFQHIWRKNPPTKFARWPRLRGSITSAGTSMRGSRNFSRRIRAAWPCAARRWRPSKKGMAPAAELAEIISVAIVRCHLRTMERLGVRIRRAAARERNPAPEVLGRRLSAAEAARSDSPGGCGQECRLLGDESRG